jgi:DNA polymerase-1
MKTIAIDTETFLITPGQTTPPVVCLTTSDCDLITGEDIPKYLLKTRVFLVGHNLTFDVLCLCEDFPELKPYFAQCYEENRMFDTKITEQMLDIRDGFFRCRLEVDEDTGEVHFRNIGYSLAECAKRRLNLDLAKGNDTWRLKYSNLYGVSLDNWPDEAKEYAVLDAVITLKLHENQWYKLDNIPDYHNQIKADFALASTSARGICVEEKAYLGLKNKLTTEYKQGRDKLKNTGFYRSNNTKNTKVIKERVVSCYGKNTPLTPNNAVKINRETLKYSGDKDLEELANLGIIEKQINSFLPVLEQGVNCPIVARYHTLTETGRTSCSQPNIQQLPRLPGVRECFVPREGYLFCSVDYDTLELRTLAQACMDICGYSVIADLLRANPHYDLHSDLAAHIVGCSVEEFLQRAKEPALKAEYKLHRQRAKIANFGFPGGLGIETTKAFARANYGVELTTDEVKALKSSWLSKYPEVGEYQRKISDSIPPGDTRTFSLTRTGFLRGNCRYTQACNFQFQGLAASGAKAALYRVVTSGKPIYPIAFLHDEILAEVPIESANEQANLLTKIMVDTMQKLCVDVPITASPALMHRWYKNAETVRDSSGKLQPWEPKT